MKLLKVFKGRFDKEEEKISELEDKVIKIIKSEEQKGKKFKSEQSPRELRDVIK